MSDKPASRIQDYQQETLPLEYIPSVSVRKMSEWLQMAWEALDNPVFGATGEEIYQALISLGFQSTADDPKAAVKASIRVGKQFIRVGTNRNKEVLWSLKESHSEPTIVPPRFTLDDPRRRKTNLKTVDYAERALKELGGKASAEELADEMCSRGWNTKSDDKPGLVAATLRKYQEFEKQGSSWVFSRLYKEQHANAE